MLNWQLKDLAPEEAAARTPVMLLNPVITRDSRAMVISTQPVSFLMRPRMTVPGWRRSTRMR
jgi:hypothetical protein